MPLMSHLPWVWSAFTYDRNDVSVEERDLFDSKSDLIAINDTRTVLVEQHHTIYDVYYGALQDLVEHYNSDDREVF